MNAADADHPYQTETMAELCARQGRIGEAIGIYRHLTGAMTDGAQRARLQRRLATLEARWHPAGEPETRPADVPLPRAPGVAVAIGDEQITVAWNLDPGTPAPALDLLLLARSSAGIEARKQMVPLATTTGRLALAAPAIHSAAAAAGSLIDGRFLPLCRSRLK
jgi:hypothetical protein